MSSQSDPLGKIVDTFILVPQSQCIARSTSCTAQWENGDFGKMSHQALAKTILSRLLASNDKTMLMRLGLLSFQVANPLIAMLVETLDVLVGHAGPDLWWQDDDHDDDDDDDKDNRVHINNNSWKVPPKALVESARECLQSKNDNVNRKNASTASAAAVPTDNDADQDGHSNTVSPTIVETWECTGTPPIVAMGNHW